MQFVITTDHDQRGVIIDDLGIGASAGYRANLHRHNSSLGYSITRQDAGTPPLETLNSIVESRLKSHVGGVPFFDALDETWRTEEGNEITREFLRLVETYYKTSCGTFKFVSSGRFGMMLHNRYGNRWLVCDHTAARFDELLLLATGGLRSGAPMDDFSIVKDHIRGSRFVFLDDSIYSGKTLAAIRTELNRLGGVLIGSYVIYDGMVERDPNVHSMYRYYDHYNADGTRRVNDNRKVC